jgi:hypothetical protein
MTKKLRDLIVLVGWLEGLEPSALTLLLSRLARARLDALEADWRDPWTS